MPLLELLPWALEVPHELALLADETNIVLPAGHFDGLLTKATNAPTPREQSTEDKGGNGPGTCRY